MKFDDIDIAPHLLWDSLSALGAPPVRGKGACSHPFGFDRSYRKPYFQPAKRTSGDFRKEGSMPRSLSQYSKLDALRAEAKRWLKAISARDLEALGRFRNVFPDHTGVPRLRQRQNALAP